MVHLVFGTMAWGFGGFRPTDREFAQAEVWGIVTRALAEDFPDWRCFQAGGTAIDRYDHFRFREKATLDDDVFETLFEEAVKEAAALAFSLGMMCKAAGGTDTRMHPARVLSGDGTVLAPRYKAASGEFQVDQETGELVEKRHDPDAASYITGDKRRVSGTKWVLTQATNGHEDERVILTVCNQPKGYPGGEAAVAVRCIEHVKDLLPDMQAYNWDKALRGEHIDRLYERLVQPVVKVALVNGREKSRLIGTHKARRGPNVVGEVEVYAIGGAPNIMLPAAGEIASVRLLKAKTILRRNRDGSARVYCRYRIPDDPLAPRRLRGAEVTVRMNGRCAQDDPSLNRAEVLRPVVEADTEEWAALNHGRPGTESTNSWLKDRLAKRRAPSVGIRRQKYDLLCAQLYNNARAIIAYRRRLGLPDVEDGAATACAA